MWQTDRHYYNSPGYYYLHRPIPFHDISTGSRNIRDASALQASVTHLLTEDPEFSVSGFSLDRTFGKVRILRRDSDAVPIRLWQDYTPNMVGDMDYQVMR